MLRAQLDFLLEHSERIAEDSQAALRACSDGAHAPITSPTPPNLLLPPFPNAPHNAHSTTFPAQELSNFSHSTSNTAATASGHLQLHMHSATYASSGVATGGTESGEITRVAGAPAGSAEDEDVWQLTVKLAGLAADVPSVLQAGSLWEQFQKQFSQVYLVRTSCMRRIDCAQHSLSHLASYCVYLLFSRRRSWLHIALMLEFLLCMSTVW